MTSTKHIKNTNSAKLPCLSTTSRGETRIKRPSVATTQTSLQVNIQSGLLTKVSTTHYNKLLFERILNSKRYLKRNTGVELNSECVHTVKLQLFLSCFLCVHLQLNVLCVLCVWSYSSRRSSPSMYLRLRRKARELRVWECLIRT